MTHRIWIRQGEGADYLMRDVDRAGGDFNSSSRPLAKKFSPYNLTAETLNAQIYQYGTTTGGTTASKFTDYPTQAGAFFQWLNPYAYISSNPTQPVVRFATYPHTSTHAGFSTFTNDQKAHYWDQDWIGHGGTYEELNETCPPGYRRPNDGYTLTGESLTSNNNVSRSEMRQSLFQNPKQGFNNQATGDLTNSVTGYYADGFFDRRLIATAVARAGGAANSAVSTGDRNVAYIGRLFFNIVAPAGSDHYCASIFFPFAGFRYFDRINTSNPNNGDLRNAGDVAEYWTSSANANSPYYGLSLIISGSLSSMYRLEREGGASIRCVKDEVPPAR
jgi:hypothetical protein